MILIPPFPNTHHVLPVHSVVILLDKRESQKSHLEKPPSGTYQRNNARVC